MSDPSGKVKQLAEGLDRVSKKQKTFYTKTASQVDAILSEVNKCKALLSSSLMETDSSPSVGDILTKLHKKTQETNIQKVVLDEQKEYHSALSKYGKVIDKSIPPFAELNITEEPIVFDNIVLNEIIAHHLFRQGRFDIAHTFLQEASIKVDSSIKEPFVEMYKILDSISSQKNLIPAIEWAQSKRSELMKHGIHIEFKLHKLQYLHLLNASKREDAILYARSHFKDFANSQMKEIQKLMGCLLYAGKLTSSPYSKYISESTWSDITHNFTSAACTLLGYPSESPLYTSVTAGSIALPKQLKVASIMHSKAIKFQAVEIELGNEFQYHPIFSCPVSREQSTADNPPMLLVCGHVLSKVSMMKLARSNTRFKCPYCPTDQSAMKAIQINF